MSSKRSEIESDTSPVRPGDPASTALRRLSRLGACLLGPVSVLQSQLESYGLGAAPKRDRSDVLATTDTIAATATQGIQGTQNTQNTQNIQNTQNTLSATEHSDRQARDHEMSLARQIQQSLLPAEDFKTGNFVCSGAYGAAAAVGGDYYDIFPLPRDRVGIVIADVAGKGLGGCMFTAMLAVLLRVIRDHHNSPAALLIDLENCLVDSLRPGTFVTVFYGILEPSTGRLTYASAAHCPLLLYRASNQSIEWRRTAGIPLGAISEGALARSLEDYIVDLRPGDLALQFTDGLNEAWNADRGEQYGYERIAAAVVAAAPRGYQAVLDALCDGARKWASPQQLEDDLTLLTIAQTGTPTATGPAPNPVASSAPHPAPHPAPQATNAVRARWFTPEEQLNDMLSDVPRLTLRADLAELVRLRPWVETCPGIQTLSSEQKMTIESGLFEVCSNIVEHGYDFAPDQEIDLWWVSTTGDDPTDPADATGSPITKAATGVGYFVICDQGRAYDPGSWQAPDLSDPADRRRPRGLGLQIIHSTAKKVVLVANTPAGNLTMLHFDPPHRVGKDKVPHG